MKHRPLVLILAFAWASAACIDNPAPGNDREANLDAVSAPAESLPVQAALAGVSPALLSPQIMTPADVGSVAGMNDACAFRMTEVGFPVFLYGSSGVLKLNDKLVRLPAIGSGLYAAGGVDATVRPLVEEDQGNSFPAEFVLRLPGAPNELGFHGFSTCPGI